MTEGAITIHAEWREVRRSPIARTPSRIRTAQQGELVGLALETPRVRALAPLFESVPIFCGDPIFAGLPGYECGEVAPDGRSYRTVGHANWDGASWLHPRFPTTIVFPESPDGADGYGGWNSQTVVHELGHVLEHRLAERGVWVPNWTGDSNWYGRTNPREAFAVAFSSWVDSDSPRYLAGHPNFFHPEPPREQMRWFDALAAELQ